MESTIERFEDFGRFQHYVVSVGKISGEMYSLPDYVERGINELLNELYRFIKHA